VNYITFAVLFTSPKCAFLVVFKAVLLLWIMRVGAFYRDLKQATWFSRRPVSFFVLVIYGFYYIFLPIGRINRISERHCFYNAESVSRFSAKLVLFIIIEGGVFTSNDWLLKIVSVV
jgi:hypothetical protein